MASVMRPPAAIPMLLVAGVALGGCGKGGTPPPTTASVGANATRRATAPGAPARAAATRARAVAFAHAVNIQAADVPGFTVSTEHGRKQETATEQRSKRELHRCTGSTGQASALAEASSSELERKAGLASQTVSSSVAVERTPAAAAEVLATFRSGRLRACLSRYFDVILAGSNLHGAHISPVAVRHGSPPAPGMTGSFGLRFTATITVQRVRIPFYVDVLGFVDGPAEVSLLTSGIPEAFPARLEEQLFALLVERAKAQTL